MARWRAIHPKISQSLDVEALSEWAQLLWDRIIANGDDFGRMRGEAALVKSLCKPLSPRIVEEFETALGEMEQAGLIRRWTVGRQVYLQIGKWDVYQGPAGIHKRTQSDFPEPPPEGAPPPGSPPEVPGNTPGTSGKVPGTSGKVPGTSGKVPGNSRGFPPRGRARALTLPDQTRPDPISSPYGDSSAFADPADGPHRVGESGAERKPEQPAPDQVAVVMEHFNSRWVPDLWAKKLRLTPKRRSHIAKRLEHFTTEELCRAIDLMRLSPHHCGVNERNWIADPEFLFRDDGQVEKFINRTAQVKQPASASNGTLGESRDPMRRIIARAVSGEPSALRACDLPAKEAK